MTEERTTPLRARTIPLGPLLRNVPTIRPEQYGYSAVDGFHRIRHYRLLSSSTRQRNIGTIRHLLDAEPPAQSEPTDADPVPPRKAAA